MTRTRFYLVLFSILLGFGSVKSAPAQRWDWNDEATATQLRSFDVFLHDHPWIAKKLWENPSRVNDQGFLDGNKEIKQWLEDHPAGAEAFHADPKGFMERERHFQMYGADLDSHDVHSAQLARFDWFLDNHPEVRKDLMKKPGLVNNGGYLEHHPALRTFLDRHPEIRAELQDHPRDFMQREGRY